VRILLGLNRSHRRSAAILLGGDESKPNTYPDSCFMRPLFSSSFSLCFGCDVECTNGPRKSRVCGGAAPAFDLPVSTAITLSFLTMGPIYSIAPFLLRAILWGVLLISISFILRRLIDRALFPILYALIVLYFVDQLRLLTALLPILGLLVFGAEMLGGTLFLIWLIWGKHSPTEGVNRTGVFRRRFPRWFTMRSCSLDFSSA
jgi:hypothetical protein